MMLTAEQNALILRRLEHDEHRMADGGRPPYSCHSLFQDFRAVISDRDRLASELQATRAELERVRSAISAIWPFVEEDDGGWTTPQYQAAIDQVRSALASMETGRA